MSTGLLAGIVATYFILLYVISVFTSKNSNTASFFNANRKAPWYLVAYGMIGASISGVTFISVPGWVKDTHFFYFQMVLGYVLGYFAIIKILLPVYYKLNLVSIYTFLEKRFGKFSYKTGSAFFLISRILGASLRMFLVVMVLQTVFFDKVGIPFWLSVIISIFLIYIYTHKAGIKTIVWTDTLQTTFMLLAVFATIWVIGKHLNMTPKDLISTIHNHPYSEVFNFDWKSKDFFLKSFFSGAFMAFVMTGLDQDMMQKNLTVKTLKESQKNMMWLSISLLPVNLLFLSLGVLLYFYAETKGIALPSKTDEVFPFLAINYFGGFASVTFLIGLIAAAFSSADSALTALTTAFAIDFLNFDINQNTPKAKRVKILVHLGVSSVVLIVILIFKAVNNESVISQLFKVATYTYAPLLALFSFGLSTKLKPNDKLVPLFAISGLFLGYIIKFLTGKYTAYEFGFESLILNALIIYAMLWVNAKIGQKKNKIKSH